LSALRVARFAGEAGTAAAGAVDPHYKLVINATDPNSQDALVHDSTIFPIVSGPWVANTDRSKWIAPLVNSRLGFGRRLRLPHYVRPHGL
jgi:hypothetical protein